MHHDRETRPRARWGRTMHAYKSVDPFAASIYQSIQSARTPADTDIQTVDDIGPPNVPPHAYNIRSHQQQYPPIVGNVPFQQPYLPMTGGAPYQQLYQQQPYHPYPHTRPILVPPQVPAPVIIPSSVDARSDRVEESYAVPPHLPFPGASPSPRRRQRDHRRSTSSPIRVPSLYAPFPSRDSSRSRRRSRSRSRSPVNPPNPSSQSRRRTPSIVEQRRKPYSPSSRSSRNRSRSRSPSRSPHQAQPPERSHSSPSLPRVHRYPTSMGSRPYQRPPSAGSPISEVIAPSPVAESRSDHSSSLSSMTRPSNINAPSSVPSLVNRQSGLAGRAAAPDVSQHSSPRPASRPPSHPHSGATVQSAEKDNYISDYPHRLSRASTPETPVPTPQTDEETIELRHYARAFLIDTLPRQIYLHCLLRLPYLYFARVDRIFQDADLTLEEIKDMALQATAEDNKLFQDNMFRLGYYHHPEATNLSPAYQRLKIGWEHFIDGLMREWKTLNIISALLLSGILTMFQIQGASSDPVTRYMAFWSLLCALLSLLYGCLFIVRFSTMRKAYKAAEWALEARKHQTVVWNVWVMLAMPVVWLAWSILTYIICIMSFMWRVRTNIPDDFQLSVTPSMELGFRIFICLVLGIGVLYGVLIINTFRHYGTMMDEAWKRRVEGFIAQSTLQPAYPPPPPGYYQPPGPIIIPSSSPGRPSPDDESPSEYPLPYLASVAPRGIGTPTMGPMPEPIIIHPVLSASSRSLPRSYPPPRNTPLSSTYPESTHPDTGSRSRSRATPRDFGKLLSSRAGSRQRGLDESRSGRERSVSRSVRSRPRAARSIRSWASWRRGRSPVSTPPLPPPIIVPPPAVLSSSLPARPLAEPEEDPVIGS